MARTSVERNISYDNIRGVYYVCLDQGRNEHGERCRSYRTVPSLRDARRLLRDFESKRHENRIVRSTSKTLQQWLEYWLDEVIAPTRAETTTYGYRKIVENHLIPFLGKIPLQRLTPQDIQRYYNMLQTRKGLSTNTIRRHHDLLAAALHTAVKQDVLAQCPVDRVEPPRYRIVETSYYTADELCRLYELVEGTGLEVPVKLAGGLGLRRNSAVSSGRAWTSSTAPSKFGRPGPQRERSSLKRKPRTALPPARSISPQSFSSCSSRSGGGRMPPRTLWATAGQTPTSWW